MKVFLILLPVFVIAADQDTYDRRYDYFEIEPLLQNKRLLGKYLDCFLDKGPCPPVGRVFKVRLPEVVRTRCAKCTPKQKALARHALNAFKQLLPDGYAQLRLKLDPTTKYYAAFETYLGIA